MTTIPQYLILPQDMVRMLDHGPKPPKQKSLRPEVQKARDDAYAAELDDWREKHPDDKPVPFTTHVTDANQLMAGAPDRYVLATEDIMFVYDLGAPTVMPKAQAEALVAQDKIRYRAEPVPVPKDDAAPAQKPAHANDPHKK